MAVVNNSSLLLIPNASYNTSYDSAIITTTGVTTYDNIINMNHNNNNNNININISNGDADGGNKSGVNMTVKEMLNQYTLYHAAYIMNRYYLWVIFAFGFPGNIVSFITILRMKPFTSPTCYVAALAFMDNAGLLFKFLFFLVTKNAAPVQDIGCATLFFLGSFSVMFANWLLVAMTVERCLAICLPLKVGSICTRKLHIAGLALVAMVLIGLNTPFFVTSKNHDEKGMNRCGENSEYSEFLKVWYWVDAVFYAILPALLLIFMNTLIILGIRRSAKIQRELTNTKANQVAETMRQQRQITIMLVVVCIAFVVLITPNALFYAVKQYWTFEQGSLEHAKFLFTNQLIFLLSDSTHAINFYLYFFSTKRFRKRCLETVFFCCLSAPHRKRTRMFRASSISGTSKTFRLSMTEVAPTQSHQALQLTHFSSSSSSSSSFHNQGQHNSMGNGNGDGPNRSKVKFRRYRDGSF